MHDHGKTTVDLRGLPKIVLVGNPNVGKSVIFSHLTGRYVTVSNYPGTTVSLTRGEGRFGDKTYQVIDTPGTYSLLPMSEDEQVTADVIFREKSMRVVQVGDAKNLERTLLVTIQLLERGAPLILNLNMMDEVEQLRTTIRVEELSRRLGIPVIPTAAVEGRGVALLKKELSSRLEPAPPLVEYGDMIEKGVAALSALLPASSVSPRYAALQLLCGDRQVTESVRASVGAEKYSELQKIIDETQRSYSLPLIHGITRQRQKRVHELLDGIVTREPARHVFSETLGEWMMRPLTGFPILILVLLALYQVVGKWAAQNAVDFLENTIFAKYLIPGTIALLNIILPIPLLKEFLVGEYGAISMGLTYAFAIVFPIVAAFFIFFGIMEDSGYLPRLAILMNRGFRVIGLNGKAIIPMVLGLGCDTMATMTTRTLDSRKERTIAIFLLALAVPCSAQLGVLLGMLGKVSALGVWIWGGVMIGTFILIGWLASLVVPGKSSDFMIEVPPLRFPKIGNILNKTFARVEWYLKEAAPLFVVGTALLFVMDKLNMLVVLENLGRPMITGFLGLPPKATEAFLVGFLRRDYGAAGLFQLSRQGLLDGVQTVVSLVTITLFIPCIANFMMMIKEQGIKTALLMAAFIVPFSFGVGGVLNLVLRGLHVVL